MSKLKELIEIYCPDGVEYKPINETTDMKRGTSLTKQNAVRGDIPVVSGGREPAFYHNKANREGAVVTVAGSGAGAGYVQYFETPIFANDCFTLQGKQGVSTKYIYYCLSNMQERIYATKKGGGVPHVHISDIENVEIPVPPLPVQEEIVRILDKFTELEEELEEELELRKKQYEYYRDKMLSLSDYDGEVEEIHLKDIGKVCMCKRIMKAQTNSDFENGVPFFKIGTFGKEPDCCISKDLFEDYKNRFSYPKKGNVLISAAGTIGRTVVFDGEPAYFQDSNIVWIDNDNSKVLDAYLNYVYQTNPWRVSDGGTISRLYNGNIEETKIVIPKNLDEQKRIIDLLDKFSTLTTDISEGLPAEIKMRRQQYEYYRDKLLDFKRISE